MSLIRPFLVLGTFIGILLVVSGCGGPELPPPGNCNCTPPCKIRINHPSGLSAFDLGYDVSITDIDSGDELLYESVFPSPSGSMSQTVEFDIPCCKKVRVEIMYVMGVVPRSPLYGQVFYYSSTEISPQSCIADVYPIPSYFMTVD